MTLNTEGLDPALKAGSHTEALVERYTERWEHCSAAEDGRTLLRLSLLRELMRELHAERSRALATGNRGAIPDLRAWEERVRSLRQLYPLEGSLVQLLGQSVKPAKRTRLLPEALFSFIEREKLERYDRQWEGTLAAEACALGWRFWSLEATVEIAQIEAWDSALQSHLWPHGIVLYTESCGDNGGFTANTVSWRGRWITVLHPNFRTPSDLNVDVTRWPGSVNSGAPAHVWKLLFSPKRR